MSVRALRKWSRWMIVRSDATYQVNDDIDDFLRAERYEPNLEPPLEERVEERDQAAAELQGGRQEGPARGECAGVSISEQSSFQYRAVMERSKCIFKHL